MVANELDSLLLLRQNHIRPDTVDQGEADPDEALKYEVELWDLLILIIDDFVVILGSEVPG